MQAVDEWETAVALLVSAIAQGVEPHLLPAGKGESLPQDHLDSSHCSKKQQAYPMYRSSCVVAPRPILVLIDLNGTMLFRAKAKIRRVACTFDHKVSSRLYYYRPFACEFIRWVSAQQSLHVSFYTSMTKVYAGPARNWLTQGFDNPLPVYDQRWNLPDETVEFGWKRDMPRLWNEINSKMDGSITFDSTNTIMIDDSPRKMRDFPDNVLIVPEFDEQGVIAHDQQQRNQVDGEVHDGRVLQAAVLLTLQANLSRLIAQWEDQRDDVRSLIAEAQLKIDSGLGIVR